MLEVSKLTVGCHASSTPFNLIIRLRLSGRYTPLEDAKILTAVQKYGDKDWLKIKEVTGIHRTTRNISAHYKYYLDPSIDRSPWSEEETKTMVELFEKHES